MPRPWPPSDPGQGPVRDHQGGTGRGPGHARPPPGCARTSLLRAWTGSPRCAPHRSEARPQRGPAADPVRCPGPGRDHLPDFPGKQLVACKNPFGGAKRARERESLLAATKAGLEEMPRSARGPGGRCTARTDRRAADRALNRRKVARHFTVDIGDDSISYAHDQASITARPPWTASTCCVPASPPVTSHSTGVVSSYKALAQV